jgi:hypothetical protein
LRVRGGDPVPPSGVEPVAGAGALGTLLGPEGTGVSSSSGRPVAGASDCWGVEEPLAVAGRHHTWQDRP